MKAKGAIGIEGIPAMLCIMAPLQHLLLQQGSTVHEEGKDVPPLQTAGEPGTHGEFRPTVFTEEVLHVESWYRGGLNE